MVQAHPRKHSLWGVGVGWVLVLLLGNGRVDEAAENPVGLPPPPVPNLGVSWGLSTQFDDVTSLPTRLTIFNAHDDAARATYSCCRPEQKEQIRRALKANETFLTLYPNSDYADDTYIHNARLYQVMRNFRKELESYQGLVANYPDSDLVDDALWRMAEMFRRDRNHGARVQVLQQLLQKYPRSTYADDALFSLAQEFKELDDEPGALTALERLMREYPGSDHAPRALFEIARRYQQVGNYPAAIDAYRTLQRMYPFSDWADDAQLNIGHCLRAMHEQAAALEAYYELLNVAPGSPLGRDAVREINALNPGCINLNQPFPGDFAEDAFAQAMHFVRFREFASAVVALKKFVWQFPGHDQVDEALFQIGVCYSQLNELITRVHEASGPEDIFRLQPEWQAAVGGRMPMPNQKEVEAIPDAVSAFAFVAAHLRGSPRRDDALYEIARCYEEAKREREMAQAFQQLMLLFPGSEYEGEALYKTLKYYHDNFPECLEIYPGLAQAYPEVFPLWLAEQPEEFRAVLDFYYRAVDHAWSEYHLHHIPYSFTGPDLLDDAVFALGAIHLQRGEWDRARKVLSLMYRWPRGDLAASAAFLLARCYERLGEVKQARARYNDIVTSFPQSGLADDAQQELARLRYAAGGKPIGPPPVEGRYGDVYMGQAVTVFAPYLIAPKLRAYNLPNIWDRAYRNLGEWTGINPTQRQAIVLDTNIGGGKPGQPIRLSARRVGDPPDWHLGLRELAYNFVAAPVFCPLKDVNPALQDAFAEFAAASLQYALVSETRDTIGSASATKLAHEDVIRRREAAVKALEKYVREGCPFEQLDTLTAAGMLIALLDQNGYGQGGLIDWSPYRRFFATLLSLPEEVRNNCDPVHSSNLLVYCLNQAFNTDLTDTFRAWGFPVDRESVRRISQLPPRTRWPGG
ncbi:MAG TPA: tetratricopeptide repeat protein [Armatimonadetes bacterium]|nr:tetratricopeptide repeat protein [Armatimonadota bacterium]